MALKNCYCPNNIPFLFHLRPIYPLIVTVWVHDVCMKIQMDGFYGGVCLLKGHSLSSTLLYKDHLDGQLTTLTVSVSEFMKVEYLLLDTVIFTGDS